MYINVETLIVIVPLMLVSVGIGAYMGTREANRREK
jgi:hypothetical protein